jgi:hypothetical protein
VAPRAFGLQNAGWDVVDLVIVGVAEHLRKRRTGRLTDPSEPAELRAEQRRLHGVLLVNVGLDAGYVAGGLALWHWRARREDAAAAGASAGIVAQGAFLLLHDATHPGRSRP